MSKYIEQYKNGIYEILDKISHESESIEKAAGVIAGAIKDDRRIHVIGSGGHSNMAVEEVLWRAGGLAPLNGILDAGTNLIHGGRRSTTIERLPGYAVAVMDSYDVGKTKDEVVIIVNAYGINSMTIDTALECRKRGITTIGVTSKSFCEFVPKGAPSRHPSGRNLYEEVDIFINNHLPLGDAFIKVDGCDHVTGSSSTFCNCFAMNLLIIETVNQLVGLGIDPPVFISGNMPDYRTHNDILEEKYRQYVKFM